MQVTPTSVSHLHTSAPSNPIVLCLPIASALQPPPGNTRMATRSERTCGRYRRNDGWVRAFFSSARSLITSCNPLEFSGHDGTSRRASQGGSSEERRGGKGGVRQGR